jgi:hypothetical protein
MPDKDRLKPESTPDPTIDLMQEREEQIARIMKRVEERLRKNLPSGRKTLDEIEQSVEQIGEEIKRDIQDEALDAQGTGHAGTTLPCPCGSLARYRGEAVRSVVTLQGQQVLARAYYYCSSCRKGFHPLDGTLELGRGLCSVRVRALACRFASYLPYAVAAQELELVCGIRLSASSVQRLAKETGRYLRSEWEARERRLRECPDADPKGPAPEQLHISMDGVMAHVGGAWREVKLGVCYQRGAQGAKGMKAAKAAPVQTSYYATLASSDQFGRRMHALGWVAKEPLCRKVAVLADGSDWIWREAAKRFTGRVQILDFFHASEHLWTVARSRFAQDEQAASEWVSEQKAELLEEDKGVDTVIQRIREWQPATEADREVRRLELGYFSTHARRMKYKNYQQAGFHIGSGVMESSCRWVVQQRMKGAGMRWSREGAECMLHLRTAWCSRNERDLMSAARSTNIAA